MSNNFQELTPEQFNQALQELLIPQLKELLNSRKSGHCMRLADLDNQLMVSLVKKLHQEIINPQVFILSNEKISDKNIYISSTKLVELRNPLPDGTLRSPLLIFLPSNFHTNAEDSFNIASFEDIDISDIYDKLVKTLLQKLPSILQGYVKEILKSCQDWTWTNSLSQARFLLTAINNGNDGETIGASLYELGLIPDFNLFNDTSLISGKIGKNFDCVQKLTNSDLSPRSRIIDLGILDKSIEKQLNQLLLSPNIEINAPKKWTKKIVLDNNYWNISFDKWQFNEDQNLDKILIEVTEVDLPDIQEDIAEERLQNLIGTQVLNPKERQKLEVIFTVDIHPLQVQGLSYFTVQIISQDSGATGTAKKVKVWKTKITKKKVTLHKLNKIEFEEGWHFIRILPWTESDTPIPLNSSSQSEQPKNESNLFYVISDVELNEDPPQRALPKDNSLEHAKIQLQFTAISNNTDTQEINVKEVHWLNNANGNRKLPDEALVVKFGKEGKRQILVPTFLKDLEQTILSSPNIINWRLKIERGKRKDVQPNESNWINSEIVEEFLKIRSEYFAVISQGEKKLISQAANFVDLNSIGYKYAYSYQNLLKKLKSEIEASDGRNFNLFQDLKNALAIDTIHILITDFRGNTKEVLLVSPTHPLRALWFVTWANVGQRWIQEAQKKDEEFISSTKEGLLKELAPLNFPFAIPLKDCRVFIAVDNIHPFWSLYAPSTESDPRGLLGDICAALEISELSNSGSFITGELLANRIKKYLVQHPYISSLSINFFNPGRATLLANTLTQLQRDSNLNYLRYDIRLFVVDPEASGVGEALENLLSLKNSSEFDNLSVSSGNHLFPKFNLAIHSIASFRQNPMEYEAHLGILMDFFPAKEIGIHRQYAPYQDKPSLHGLIQDFNMKFQDDENGTFWQRQPSHRHGYPQSKNDDLTNLLTELPQIISGSISTVSSGETAFEQWPVITLGLEKNEKEIINFIHQVCDWVFTIDRNIDVEFFDHGGQKDRPPYLVDYTPNSSTSFGHRLIITSRSLSELESILSQILNKYDMKVGVTHLSSILDHLRSLSGQLALKLLSTHQQQIEVLGLALARQFLLYQKALCNQIIIPLDSHIDLFRKTRKIADELGETVGIKRTDLALFYLNLTTRTIHCNLVEVKCYTNVGGISNFTLLKNKIAEQIKESEQVLRDCFEDRERPDRLLRLREFLTVLNFYLERSIRYKLIYKDTAAEAKLFLATLSE